MSDRYDIMIIGGGVVGCAIARELSRYEARIALVEKHWDVGEGTSKANSAIIHTGFDAIPGTLEARLVREGWKRFQREAETLRIPLRRCGAVLLALTEAEHAQLEELKETAHANGVTDTEIVSAARLRELAPHVNEEARAALWVPGESITCPFTAVYAMAEHATANGVDLRVGHEVLSIARGSGGWLVQTDRGPLTARLLINCAGLWSDDIAAMRDGEPPFRVTGRKGEFIILDRKAEPLVPRIVLPMPTPRTKGILVAPTIFGNVLMGPTAVDVEDKADRRVTTEGLAQIRREAYRLVPRLAGEPEICTYAGVRAVGPERDYTIRVNGKEGYADVTGVRSTGLTASMGIAAYVVERLTESGFPLKEKSDYRPAPTNGRWPGWYAPPYMDPQRLAENPAYGRMVCYCENVSEQEVLDAVRACPGPATVDAIKRRTRATTGRCQGFNCMARVVDLISHATATPIHEVWKSGPGSHWVVPPRW